jgi:hypothetical protein
MESREAEPQDSEHSNSYFLLISQWFLAGAAGAVRTRFAAFMMEYNSGLVICLHPKTW